ncbi:DUF6263 family protein [Hymenobacter sp. H14-R3]|uniref:DUF6263 family protein n=1 Tax=Hymenobacter sp. H14-R3 TaxID=3046308 RepID=UPI0024BA7DAE|nr:DUF6263 family protein [Hymenobacter sp. H14-R3]MDJ0363796.1 DUF6263 family protein [Hymenobacter sp. H14-R3]
MTSSFTGLVVAALVLSGCGSPSEATKDEAVNLKFNFAPGSKFTYAVESDQQIDAPGQKIGQSITMVSSYAVRAGAGTSKNLTVSYDRIAMKMETMGHKLAYDSNDPGTKSSPLATMGGLVGKSFEATLTDEGKVTAIKGAEALVNGTVDPASPNAAAMRAQLNKSLNDSTLRGDMEQSFYIYPGHAVKPGDTWSRTIKLAVGPLSIRAASIYKLTSMSAGVAHLGIISKLEGQGAMDMDGTQTGTMDVELATGMLLDSKIAQTLTSKAGAPTAKITTTIHITGTKK